MKELLEKLELFYCATNIPLRLYNSDNSLVSSCILESQAMPAPLEFLKYQKELLAVGEDTLYYTSDMNEHYYSFCFEQDAVKYRVVCGPTIDGTFDKQYLLRISGEKNLKLSDYSALDAYFRSLPVYTSIALRRTEPLLRYLMGGRNFDYTRIVRREGASAEFAGKNIKAVETRRYHHSINKDELMMEAVKDGDRERLFSLLCTPGDGPEGILCKNDPVRSYKNLFIVTVSYTTKAALEGGVDSESAYTLSDTFIQTVEETDSYEKITELFIIMFNSFMDLVEKAKKMRYTGPVYKTVEYINKHYYRNITVKELSIKVHLSESHLLRLFRQQTGMGIKSYIVNRRIREVKSLLGYTDHSIAVICEMAGFSDQSYMTGIFRRLVGTTPKRYRELAASQCL